MCSLYILYHLFFLLFFQDLSGKINFNFKDHGAVWALTKCLLQRDFKLNVEIIPGHLVPTLPLRLNYLLWIEDLLVLYKPKTVLGIDIGKFLQILPFNIFIAFSNNLQFQVLGQTVYIHYWLQKDLIGICYAQK